jgi:hypothetical protein
MYSPDGGTSGEMSVRWEKLDGQLVPYLHCYDDAWSALSMFKDVIDAMAEHDSENITPAQFCQLLDGCGFVDATPRRYEDSYSNE